MNKGFIQIFCGDGKGKTNAAIGYGIRAVSKGESVVIIQFLKGKNADEISFINRLEPEIKLFRFEKHDDSFENLSEEAKKDEIMNIKNGLHFAKKVLVTGECNVLILDEILGLIDKNIMTKEELISLMQAKNNETELIMTGRNLSEEICSYADEVSQIETLKTNVDNSIL